MEDKKAENPSIPLTANELMAIGGIRTSKQRNKRALILLIPTIVLLVVGTALLGVNRSIAYLVMLITMAGAVAGLMVIMRWSNKIVTQFAREHQGSYWRKVKEEKNVETK